eukprot:4231130-Pyramimonas_sp.AAC.1
MQTFQGIPSAPSVGLDLFTDDIGISSAGAFHGVLTSLKSATVAVYLAVANDLKSVISPDEAQLVAGDPSLGKLLSAWLGTLAGPSAGLSAAVDLGVDDAAGSGRRTCVGA